MTTITINEYLNLPEEERPDVTYEGLRVASITPEEPDYPLAYRIYFTQVRSMEGKGDTLLQVATKNIQVVTLDGARHLIGFVTPTRSKQRKAGDPVSRQYINAQKRLKRIEIEGGSLALFPLAEIHRLWPATKEIDPMSIGVAVLAFERVPDLTEAQRRTLQALFTQAREGQASERVLLESLPDNLHPAQRLAAVRTIQGILNAAK